MYKLVTYNFNTDRRTETEYPTRELLGNAIEAIYNTYPRPDYTYDHLQEDICDITGNGTHLRIYIIDLI